MTIAGYGAHQRRAAEVVGVSHMSTHEVMRFAEVAQCYTGWLLAEGSQPQLEGVRAGTAQWVALAEMFADRRIVMTDGLASGPLLFVAALPAHGQPPADRPLLDWADGHRLPWVQIIDNEAAYWGGLSEALVERLLAWFCSQRPLALDWRTTRFDRTAAGRLRRGLFDHGWTRNLDLVKSARRTTVDLWGGVHGSCILDHRQFPVPSTAHAGVRLTLADHQWTAGDLGERCQIDDDNGKLLLWR